MRRWPWLVLLAGYLALILARQDGAFQKDEITYWTYAHQLLEGRFAPEGTQFLWCGPGYPLLLAPFAQAGSILGAKLLNAGLLFAMVLLFYRTAKHYVAPRQAQWAAGAMGLYWPLFDELHRMMTEVFTALLVVAAVHAASNLARRGGVLWLLWAAVLLGYLALTKILFGYVLAAGAVLALIGWAWKRTRGYGRAFAALALGLACTTPYLLYTHRLTGEVFYWGSSGGLQLYWMSSPHPDERGDWINYVLAARKDPTPANPVIKNHAPVLAKAWNYAGTFEPEPYERFIRRLGTDADRQVRAIAWQQIQAHPWKFLRNGWDNLERMLWDAPYSYRAARPAFWKFAAPNAVLLCLLLQAAWHRRRRGDKPPGEALAVATILAIYLFGSGLVSAYPRQFYVVAPAIGWLTLVLWAPRPSPDHRPR